MYHAECWKESKTINKRKYVLISFFWFISYESLKSKVWKKWRLLYEKSAKWRRKIGLSISQIHSLISNNFCFSCSKINLSISATPTYSIANFRVYTVYLCCNILIIFWIFEIVYEVSIHVKIIIDHSAFIKIVNNNWGVKSDLGRIGFRFPGDR